MCVIQNCVCVCALVKFERERISTANYKSSTVCTSRVLLASNGENLVLRPNKMGSFFEISISNLFRFMALIF